MRRLVCAAVVGMMLAGCEAPAAPSPSTTAAPGAPPAKPARGGAWTEPMKVHEQKPPWEVFLNSQFYYDMVNNTVHVIRVFRDLGSTYVPQVISAPPEEHVPSPILKERKARVEAMVNAVPRKAHGKHPRGASNNGNNVR